MNFYIALFFAGVAYGLFLGLAHYRSRLQLARENRDYWFKQYSLLSEKEVIRKRESADRRDGADWWKEDA
jgi:hypothetical protein